MTAPKARKTASRARKDAEPQTDFYDRQTPSPVAGRNTRGVFFYTDGVGGPVVYGEEREVTATDPPHDVRQTDLRTLNAAKRARFEAARRPGVAIPLPEYGEPEGVDNP